MGMGVGMMVDCTPATWLTTTLPPRLVCVVSDNSKERNEGTRRKRTAHTVAGFRRYSPAARGAIGVARRLDHGRVGRDEIVLALHRLEDHGPGGRGRGNARRLDHHVHAAPDDGGGRGGSAVVVF